MLTQAIGLLLGVPFIFLTGWTLEVPVLVCALMGFGFFKGFYDANIWAALYDVVRPERRATALGIMNSLGWFGGGTAPVIIAVASESWGMGACLSATAAIYLVLGVLLGISFFASLGKRREAAMEVFHVKTSAGGAPSTDVWRPGGVRE